MIFIKPGKKPEKQKEPQKLTIEEIAARMNECGEGKCDNCDYNDIFFDCRQELIKEMAGQCRRIANELEDDGK